MSNFALKNIDAVCGQQKFDKLIIDDKCLLDSFIDNLEDKYLSEMGSMYAYMQRVADLEPLPDTKFHPLNKNKTDGYTEYEFKTKHLRIYAISQPNGKIIILGGYKNRQDKDLKTFRSIVKRYIQSQKGSKK